MRYLILFILLFATPVFAANTVLIDDGTQTVTNKTIDCNSNTCQNFPGGLTPPGSSTDNAVVRWNGIGADTVQDSSVTIDDNGKLITPTGTGAGYFFGDGDTGFDESVIDGAISFIQEGSEDFYMYSGGILFQNHQKLKTTAPNLQALHLY